MTDIILYPMALYPAKGEMLIVNNEQEHLDALASWEVAVEPVAEAVEADDEPETFDDAGVPIKRGPGRPRKVIP